MSTDVDIPSVLRGWRRQAEYEAAQPQPPRSSAYVPLLAGALDAVLKQHQPGRITLFGALCKRHESHRHFSITSTEAAGVQACQDCAATVYNSCTGCGPQMNVDLCPTRNAITRTLTGEGEAGG